MPKKVHTRTGIAGDTANDRRLLADSSTSSADPSLKGDGILLQRNEFIHLFFKLTATDPATYFPLQLWWYTPISGMWHKGETLTVNANDVSTFEVQGMDRIYVQVVAPGPSYDGVTYPVVPILDAWIGLVVPV
jgi:hypothetical protein